jgi:hypothetical protein
MALVRFQSSIHLLLVGINLRLMIRGIVVLLLFLLSYIPYIGYSEDKHILQLIGILHDTLIDTKQRISAIEELETIEDIRVVNALIKCFDDINPEVREKVVAAFGSRYLRNNAYIAPIVDALRNGNDLTRRGAIRARAFLGYYPDDEEIIRALNDADPYVRINAADLLTPSIAKEKIHPKAEKVILDHISEKDLAVVLGSHEYWIMQGDPSMIQVLIDALNRYGNVEAASNYLNSRNPQLQKAAREWAFRNHYTEIDVSGSSNIRWGSSR